MILRRRFLAKAISEHHSLRKSQRTSARGFPQRAGAATLTARHISSRKGSPRCLPNVAAEQTPQPKEARGLPSEVPEAMCPGLLL